MKLDRKGAALGEGTTLQCTDEVFPSFVLHWFPGHIHACMHVHTHSLSLWTRRQGLPCRDIPQGCRGAYILILVNLALIHMG